MKCDGLRYSLLIALVVLLLTGCAVLETVSTAPTATPVVSEAANPTSSPVVLSDPLLGLANVESLEIMTLESFPVQIDVRIAGVHPNDCTEIDEIVVQMDGNSFNVVAIAMQEPGIECNDVVVPFEEIVSLDVYGLDAGLYTVNVNSIQGSFALDEDNLLPEEDSADVTEPTTEPTADPIADPTAEPPVAPVGPTGAETFAITGLVWHDLCPVAAEDDAELAAGCVESAAGAVQANGLFENEPGIAGVRVSIGEGTCPSTGYGINITGIDGEFSFDNLAPGTYCISVNSENPQNQEVLLPGQWTAPVSGPAQTIVNLTQEEPLQTVNFGWDYQLLPAEVDLATCSNSFAFVADVNIDDDTVFAPGELFTKRWQLRNNGTCPWSSEYSILFVGGDQMSADESIPLAEAVAVGQTIEVAVDMIAPQEPGTYRGNWQIANTDGNPFGIDGVIEDAFWLRIIVEEDATPGATAEPNSGAIGGVVWDDFCINGNPGRGCQESGENSGFYTADGTFDALESGLGEIIISLAEEACPADGTLPPAGAVISTAVTDQDGRYLFEGLSEGTYCIFMDALSTENVDFLIPGNWTWPAAGVGRYTFVLGPGEQALDRDFGWDFVE
jgi:hypothetical protein